ncbi:MAG: metallophosphoesterase [Pirellulales bacterium]|nr:metallophosphoesterase [Pirellulales bacterium]
MSQRPFRFLHASDLHVDVVPSGVAHVPPHLKQTWADAPLSALATLVDTALAESVDFVVLAGDVVQANEAGPYTISQLCQHLARLAEADIPVYWAAGDVDAAADWPPAIELPSNVHRFGSSTATRIQHVRDDLPLVKLIGQGRKHGQSIQAKDLLDSDDALPAVVIAHGEIDVRKTEKLLAKRAAPAYLALGGQHRRDTLLSAAHTIHYPGTPQGRSPAEDGAHGVTLVEFDQQGVFHTSFLETDTLRWIHETIEADRATTVDQVEQVLRTRLDTIADAASTQIVRFTVVGQCDVARELTHGTLAADLAELLQADYGHRQPPLWVSEISASAKFDASSRAADDTILGDFLQTIAAFESGEQSLDLSSVLPDGFQLDLAPDLQLSQPGDAAAVLDEARSRGIELLSTDGSSTTAAIGNSS